jgi:hypothetical protein
VVKPLRELTLTRRTGIIHLPSRMADGKWQVSVGLQVLTATQNRFQGSFPFSSKLITGLKVEARDGTWRGFTACCFTASALC